MIASSVQSRPCLNAASAGRFSAGRFSASPVGLGTQGGKTSNGESLSPDLIRGCERRSGGPRTMRGADLGFTRRADLHPQVGQSRRVAVGAGAGYQVGLLPEGVVMAKRT